MSDKAPMETLLGRPVLEGELGPFASLNDIPPSLIAELRVAATRMDPKTLVLPIRYLLRDGYLTEVVEFVRDVLIDGADASRWRVHDALIVPTLEADEGLLAIRCQDLEARVADVQGARWFALQVCAEAELRDHGVGLPGVFVRERRHNAPRVRGTTWEVVSSSSELVPTTFDLAVRRWLTRRMAGVCTDGGSTVPPSVDGIVERLAELGHRATPSVDALIAARALLREASHGLQPFPALAGYLGPDEWFT